MVFYPFPKRAGHPPRTITMGVRIMVPIPDVSFGGTLGLTLDCDIFYNIT